VVRVTRIDLDQSWMIFGHLDGGYLAAVMGEAASQALDGAPPLTISTHYLGAARGGGPADVEVEVVRRGRLSTARVTLSRDAKALVDGFVTVGVEPQGGGRIDDAAPPEIPAWDHCPDSAAVILEGSDLLQFLEVRPDPAGAAAISGGPALDRAVMRGWMAYRDRRPADLFLAMAAWDALPPAPWAAHVWGQLPTVSAQVLLFPGAIVGPLLVEARCETLRDGIADETSRVWDATGRLVASARQTAVLRAG
jgi:acyl-coenzyme A thioesterase PaaI-like protein